MIKTTTIHMETAGNSDIVDITQDIQSFVSSCKAREGSVNIFVPGSTASVTTIEHEGNLVKDMKKALERLAPENMGYDHHRTWGDHNGHSHVRAGIMGPCMTIPFKDGKLMLGTWQQAVLIDFDEKPRRREIVLQTIW